MPEHYQIIMRTIMAFSVLLLGAKILGKQIIAQMNTIDFIASISIGAILANLAFNLSIKVHHALIAFAVLIVIILATGFISLKSRKARKFVGGNPTVVIENGKILEENMKKIMYSLDSLNQQLRGKGIFNIQEVLFALVETNGTLSVSKKPQYRTVTREDLNIPIVPEKNLAIELIMDGKVIQENLKQNGLSEHWLHQELLKRNVHYEDVVYAVLVSTGKIYMDTGKDYIESPMDKE